MRDLITATITRKSNTSAVVDYYRGADWQGAEVVEFRRSSYRIHPGAPSKDEQDRSRLFEMAYSAAEFRCAHSYGGAILNTVRWTA